MAESKVQIVPYPDHPDRCQGRMNTPGREGQCDKFKMEGSNFCAIHGGAMDEHRAVKESLNLYRLRKWEKRARDFKAANGARTIDEELAILRIMLEEVLNKCGDEMELLLYSTKITELVREIRTTVIAADKLATKANTLIGRPEAMVIAGKVVWIIGNHIDDQALLARIADEIGEAFLSPEESNDA